MSAPPKGLVTLSCHTGPEDVTAYITPHFAVHRSLGCPRNWTVTHRRTGFAMAAERTLRAGLRLARDIEANCVADLKLLARLKFGQLPTKRNGAALRLRAVLGSLREAT